jgi:transposase-like protein
MAVMWNEIAKARGYNTVGQMLRALYPKFTLQALSGRFGCSVDAVRRQLEKENIPIRARGGALIQPKLGVLTADDFKTKTVKEVAQEHGVDPTSVYKYLKRKGITPPSVEKRRAVLEENEKGKTRVVEDLEETLDEILTEGKYDVLRNSDE